MSETPFDIQYIAQLARLELTEEEAGHYQEQLQEIISYMKKLDVINVDGIEPTAHASPAFDRFREDIVGRSFSQEEALSNAPKSAQGQFQVTKVIE